MTKKKSRSSETSNINIDGDVRGQIAIGSNISQSQTEIHHTLTSADLDEFRQAIQELRTKVEAETPPDKKNEALEQVQELERAIIEDKKPDLSTMEYVKNWFGRNIPALAGAVTSIVVHPIVGKLVEAGGDMLVKEFQFRFGRKT